MAVLFSLLNLLFPLREIDDYSQIITARDGKVLHAFLNKEDKWRMYTELTEISPALRKAIVYKEDRLFHFHYGINPLAICRALFNNIVKRKKTSGASTVSMQVARLMYPKERTYLNKFIEMFRAVQLEWKFSKDEILQLYLNLVPYGGNIEGVKAASLLHFGRLPNYLSIAQISTLVIIPNRPTSLKLNRYNIATVKKERNKWLERYRNANIFSNEEIEDALKEPLEGVRESGPKLVPHFAYRIRAMYPGQFIVNTTLDLAKQEKVENITYNYNQRLKLRNINNAAVLVINNKTMEIEAYVGSPDFRDNQHSGQVDGINAVRSPGSTLKPLIYGLAMDKGFITPKAIIADVPVNFDGYTPENFDDKYNGSVSVEKALAYSLNVPAVKTLEKLGVLTLLDKLKVAGFKQIIKDDKKLGLSVALGGCGVRLEELVKLYSSFANYGVCSNLKWVKNDTSKTQADIMSPAAAYMVSEILTMLIRPDLPNNYQSSFHIPKIAWKTGTSYGRKDAWSIGYNKKYTIGVWVGNFNGVGVPDLTGADMATPLLFELFNSLDYNSDGKWFKEPDNLDFRLVCAESGLIPEEYCENQIIDYYIPRLSSTEKCEHLKMVNVSTDEQFSYCTSCLPSNSYKKKYYPNFSQEIVAFYELEHLEYTKIPQHNPACTRVFSQNPPVITSPVDNKEYLLEKKEQQQLMLTCNANNDVKTVYWYINDRFYKTAASNEKVFFTPTVGKQKVSCGDDKGRTTSCKFDVVFY